MFLCAFLTMYLGYAQEREITGKVTDSNGQPIPGVTVVVPGTMVGIITDMEGDFSINVPVEASTLRFSFVGMQTQTLNISEKSEIDVVK